MSVKARRTLIALLCCAVWVTPPSPASDASHRLSEKYQKFLEDCELLLSKSERKAFLALEKDYQRDGFIQRFWQARDPYPETERNEFKTQWEGRLEEGRQTWKYPQDDRRRVFQLHGHPDSLRATDCGLLLWPIEIWRYHAAEQLPRGFVVVFVQKGAGGPFRQWHRSDGFKELQAIYQELEERSRDDYYNFYQDVHRFCIGLAEEVLAAVDATVRQEKMGMGPLIETRPKVRDDEWLDAFRGFSTDLPADASLLGARLEVRFPDRDGGRTVVQGLVLFEGAEARPSIGGVGGEPAYELQLTGEVLREDELFESFRYRFTIPSGPGASASPSLAFERLLRPGDYTLILKLEDLHSQRAWRESRPFVVPRIDTEIEPAVAAALDAARREIEAPIVRLRAPAEGTAVVAGPQRFTAEVEGAVAAVRFLLDGDEMLTKNRPPFAVDLLLGALPRTRTLRALALDERGAAIASDELVINPAPQRFAVRIIEPIDPGAGRLRAEVQVPDGSRFDRLEFYRGEQRIATLYQPPYTAPLPSAGAPAAGINFVRAVAYLDDGLSAEDLVYLASPDYGERVDVRLVEIYATVLDASKRPVRDLTAADFSLREAGAPQQLVRFEAVDDLPLHVLLAVDTSASMTKNLDRVREAARSFFARTVRPSDRAALVTFSDQPALGAEFTNDLEALTQALASIAADRGTALWDSVVFSLHYMQGASGQSALVVLSDGADRSSKFRFEEALEFAQRAGVAVYTVGTDVPLFDRAARHQLCKLADQTGGRCFFITDASDLDPIYTAIEQELRSRYLLVYQPSSEGKPGVFRPIQVTVAGGREVKAPAGYWP